MFFIDRYGIHLGVLFIHFYGVIIMTGVLVAAYLATRRAKIYQQNPEHVWDMLTWVVIAGVVCARLWHIFTPTTSNVQMGLTTSYYLSHPLAMLAIWNGGLGIPGAVFGGVVALYFYARKNKLHFGLWLDIFAPGLALAQAIGRWGNYINQELYGLPTNLPWALYIEPAFRVAPYQQVTHYHPLFLYESLWNILNMAVLLLIGERFAKKIKSGDIFLCYLIIYPTGRFFLEFLRLDYSALAGINANQVAMAIIALLAVLALIWRHRDNQSLTANNEFNEKASFEAEIEDASPSADITNDKFPKDTEEIS